jgi:hypothetical protein
MKIKSLRTPALLAIVVLALFSSAGTAPAIDLGIQVGGGPPPPPPPGIERPWAPPYRGAVWIRPHREWRGGGWVWVHGYYDYPPYPGARWIEGHYRNGYWRPGHWSRRY